MKTLKKSIVALILFQFLTASIGLFAAGEMVSAQSDKPVELSWLGPIWGDCPDGGNMIQQVLEERFNVKITSYCVQSYSETEKVQLMLAAGDIPDVMWLKRLDQLKVYEDGVCRSIPQSMIRKYAPEYTRRMDKYGIGWKMHLAPGKTDEHYAMVVWEMGNTGAWKMPHFRYDWLLKIGMAPDDAYDMYPNHEEMPGRMYLSKSKPTIDWFEKVLIAFRDEDPDGNGKNDTIPLGLGKRFDNLENVFWGMYGISPGKNLMENGELIMPEISEAYKKYLKQMNKWYEMGLIDQEFPTLEQDKWNAMVAEGMFGAWNEHGIYMNVRHKSQNTDLLQKDPNAKLLITAPITGPEGMFGSDAWAADNGSMFTGPNYQIGINADDTQLAKFLELWDATNFADVDLMVFTRYGKEGVHFEWEGERNNSFIKLLDYPGKTPGMKIGTYHYCCPNMIVKEFLPWTANPMDMELMSFFRDGPGTTQFAIRLYRNDILGETKAAEYSSEALAVLTTLHEEFHFKAITGQIDIDADWDAYVRKWRQSGGDKILGELAKAPLVSELLKGKFVY